MIKKICNKSHSVCINTYICKGTLCNLDMDWLWDYNYGKLDRSNNDYIYSKSKLESDIMKILKNGIEQ